MLIDENGLTESETPSAAIPVNKEAAEHDPIVMDIAELTRQAALINTATGEGGRKKYAFGPRLSSSDPVERHDALIVLLSKSPNDNTVLTKELRRLNDDQKLWLGSAILRRNPTHADLISVMHACPGELKTEAATRLINDHPTEDDLCHLVQIPAVKNAACAQLMALYQDRDVAPDDERAVNAFGWILNTTEDPEIQRRIGERLLRMNIEIEHLEYSPLLKGGSPLADEAWERVLGMNPDDDVLLRFATHSRGAKRVEAARLLMERDLNAEKFARIASEMKDLNPDLAKTASLKALEHPKCDSDDLANVLKVTPELASVAYETIRKAHPGNDGLIAIVRQFHKRPDIMDAAATELLSGNATAAELLNLIRYHQKSRTQEVVERFANSADVTKELLMEAGSGGTSWLNLGDLRSIPFEKVLQGNPDIRDLITITIFSQNDAQVLRASERAVELSDHFAQNRNLRSLLEKKNAGNTELARKIAVKIWANGPDAEDEAFVKTHAPDVLQT